MRTFRPGLWITLILLALPACKMDWQPLCSPRNCPGCCQGGVCQLGITQGACGSGGADCSSCGAYGHCSLNACLSCTPACTGKVCGDDGCGGTCGSCAPGTACDDTGFCAACTPECTGKSCGSDSCGGSCGTCTGGTTCNSAGACVTTSCTPNCAGKVCGDDGCGGSCGTCAMGHACDSSGQCNTTCTPQCSGKLCGDDGCGGSCGTCGSGTSCSSGQCVCVPSCAGKVCGDDGCGGSCGSCSGSNVCNSAGQCVSSCTPSCSGKQCGSDGCQGSCGACGSGTACNAAGQCQCAPQCAGRQCGSDGCGGSCGSCGAGLSCNGSGQCVCVPSCGGAQCGSDGCGGSCGTCPSGTACNSSGSCVSTCTAETNSAFCARLGKTCGTVSDYDNCGTYRSASCGSCSSGYACSSTNICVATCTSETNAAFCSRLGKTCGSVSDYDNCGAFRTASCGSCSSGYACSASNVCVATTSALVFKTTWQTLPSISGHTVQFRCAGTVTTSSSGGTRCETSGQDPVQLSIDGSTYVLYPGCDGYRNTNCMTSIDPSSATYKDDEVNAGGRLLCDAMGWTLGNTLADKNPGTTSRWVAVVQSSPSVTGTDSAVKNYGTYVECNP